MVFLLPFKNYDMESFPDVHVPLSQAPPRHPSVVAMNQTRRASTSGSVGSGKHDKSAAQADSSIGFTLEDLREEVELDVAASGHDSAYDRKSKVINKAIQDIGMGSYQWRLFVLCGFGWLADNLWLQGVALTLPSVSREFGISTTQVRYTTLALFAGLCCGAVFWGTASDIIGRRLAFNMTLLITAVFGLAVGGAQSWIAVCGLYAALGAGVGGNLPVDGALFLEFLPCCRCSGRLASLSDLFLPGASFLTIRAPVNSHHVQMQVQEKNAAQGHPIWVGDTSISRWVLSQCSCSSAGSSSSTYSNHRNFF
jgi:Sugar (and other) transporter